MYGGAGNDLLYAGVSSSDVVYGGDGADVLYLGGGGGANTDLASTLYGGGGADTFVIFDQGLSGHATAGVAGLTGHEIFGFEDGSDKIQLIGFGFTASGSLGFAVPGSATFTTGGNVNQISDSANNKVTIYVTGANGTSAYVKLTVEGVTTVDINDFNFG